MHSRGGAPVADEACLPTSIACGLPVRKFALTQAKSQVEYGGDYSVKC